MQVFLSHGPGPECQEGMAKPSKALGDAFVVAEGWALGSFASCQYPPVILEKKLSLAVRNLQLLPVMVNTQTQFSLPESVPSKLQNKLSESPRKFSQDLYLSKGNV